MGEEYSTEKVILESFNGEESSTEKVILQSFNGEESSKEKVILQSSNGEESSTEKVILQSSDGEVFVVEQTIASQSQTIRQMVEDDCANDVIPLPNVKARVLVKVIEYCKKHAGCRGGEASSSSSDQKDKNELKHWDKEFLRDMVVDFVLELILAAHYLNVQDLMDLTCQHVADHIKHMSPEEVRKVFHIDNDFTPEEEAKVGKENEWAFN